MKAIIIILMENKIKEYKMGIKLITIFAIIIGVFIGIFIDKEG